MTPAQFAALTDRLDSDGQRNDFRFGMIVSTVVNMFKKQGERPLGPLEAMGHTDEESVPTVREQTPEETRLRMRLLEAAQRRVANVNAGAVADGN